MAVLRKSRYRKSPAATRMFAQRHSGAANLRPDTKAAISWRELGLRQAAYFAFCPRGFQRPCDGAELPQHIALMASASSSIAAIAAETVSTLGHAVNHGDLALRLVERSTSGAVCGL